MNDIKGFLGWDMAACAVVLAVFIVRMSSLGRRRMTLTGPGTPPQGASGTPVSVVSPLRRYQRKLELIGAGFFSLLFTGAFVINHVGGASGISMPWRIGLPLAWLVGVPVFLRYFRYPGSLKLSHSLVIHAPPDTVWNAVTYRQTTDYWRATVAKVVRICAEREIYDVHIRDLGNCQTCGLPKPPDRSKIKTTVEILERRAGGLERTRSTLPSSHSRPVVRDEQNEWRIEPHPDGSLVTRSSIGIAPLMWFWIISKLRNPSRDSLIALKSYLEGTRGAGAFAAAQEMLDTARAAAGHCRCE